MRELGRRFRRLRRGAVALVLVAVLVWPAVHHLLVRAVQFDFWEHAGWAMYASVSNKPQGLRVVARSPAGGETVLISANPVVRRAVQRFLRQRRYFGRHVRPAPVWTAVAETMPGWEVTALELRWLWYEPALGEVVRRTDRYDHPGQEWPEELPLKRGS